MANINTVAFRIYDSDIDDRRRVNKIIRREGKKEIKVQVIEHEEEQERLLYDLEYYGVGMDEDQEYEEECIREDWIREFNANMSAIGRPAGLKIQ